MDSRDEKEGRRWWRRGLGLYGRDMEDDREFMALVFRGGSLYFRKIIPGWMG